MRLSLKSRAVKAAVNVDDIRRHFYDEVAVGDQYWWWIAAMYVDPAEIIIDTDEGDIYRMGYTVKGDAIEFGDPQKVQIQYVDATALPKKAQAAAAVAGMNSVRGDHVLAAFTSRDESRPVDASKQEGADVDLTRLKKRLGLSADTPDEEVLAAAEEELGTEAPAPPDPPAEPPAEPIDPDDDDPEAERAEEAGAGGVVVDASVLASLRADAAAGRAARDEQIRERDESTLALAIRQGKIPPARKAHYATLLKADREGTVALLESLEPDLVPLTARGGSDETVEEGQAGQTVGYPSNWLPEVAARKAALAAGARPRVTIS